MSRGRLFAGAVLLQVLFLGGVYLVSQGRAAAGTVVRLQVAPVDPYSPFRGRYAVFELAISTLPEGVDLPSGAQAGREVYVTLENGGLLWRAVDVSLDRPAGVFIAGVVAGDGEARVRFPVREFFLSERGADRLQELLRAGPVGGGLMMLEVSLDDDGQAIPVALYWGRERLR